MSKILLVDDKIANLVALEAILENCGAKLFTATSGNEALALMLEEKFALVLLDVQMPGMDGYEVAELMRQNPDTQDIPIIFVTAINKEKMHVFKGYESGAVDYIFKPIDDKILKSKVSVFIQLDRKNEELLNEIELRKQAENEKNKIILQLQDALSEVKTLRGIIPICSKCKSIRDDQGFWQRLEDYLLAHSDIEMTHSLCLKCAEEMYGGEAWYEKSKEEHK